MSDKIVKNDRVVFGVLKTKGAAMLEAELLKADQVRVITLHDTLGKEPIGYVTVPSQHQCGACGQYIGPHTLFGTPKSPALTLNTGEEKTDETKH